MTQLARLFAALVFGIAALAGKAQPHLRDLLARSPQGETIRVASCPAAEALAKALAGLSQAALAR